MPIEALPSYLKVEEPYQATPKKSSALEVFGQGISNGLRENTVSYLADIGELLSTSLHTEYQEFTEEEFKAHPLYREGMKYYPGMNYNLLNKYSETYTRNQETQLLKERADNFWVPYVGGALLSGFVDPVNFIPFGAHVKGANFLYNVGRVGGANALIETGLTPVTMAAYSARGEEYTPLELATNLGFAFAAGGVISAGLTGLGKVGAMIDPISNMGIAGEYPTLARTLKEKPDSIKLNKTVEDLLNKNQLSMADQPGTHVRNTNPFTDFDVRYIDTTGSIHTSKDAVRTKDRYVVVSKGASVDGKSVLQVQGKNKSVLQILNELTRYMDDGDTIIVKRMDLPGRDVTLSKKEIGSWVDREADKITDKAYTTLIKERGPIQGTLAVLQRMTQKTFAPVLEDSWALRTRPDEFETSYEFEFNLDGKEQGFDIAQGIGTMYEIKNSVKRKLSPEESNVVLKQFQAQARTEGKSSVVLKRTSTVTATEKMADSVPDKVQAEKLGEDVAAGKTENLSLGDRVKQDLLDLLTNNPEDSLLQVVPNNFTKTLVNGLQNQPGMPSFSSMNIRYNEATGLLEDLGDVIPTTYETREKLLAMKKNLLEAVNKNKDSITLTTKRIDEYEKCKGISGEKDNG